VLDMRDGTADGVPALADRNARERWSKVLEDEYEEFCDRVDEEEDTLLDPYAAEAPEEFFAVAAEAFFVAPREFLAEHPRMYELLRGFFQQHPASHVPQ
jgi:Mlc titration factor MtfA (ptsG expression regulator)